MSNSIDSLKKKVCVTVFLDELFEEVNDEDHRDSNKVNEVTGSEVKIADQTCKTSSEYDFSNHEKINNSPNSDTKENEREPRPRKHRRESKFSRNPCYSFKDELDKYKCGVNNKTEFKRAKPVESTFSDNDLDQYLELSKCLPSGSKSSLSEFIEVDLSEEENFATINLSLSSMMVCREKGRSGFTKILDDNIQSGVISYCSKSTQFDGRKKDVEKGNEKFESYPLLTEDQDLMWKKNGKRIQLILAKARSGCKDQEVCDRDSIKHFGLRSILKECDKQGKKNHSIDGFETYMDLLSKAMDAKESDVQNISDAYTCVFPRDIEESQNRTVEVKRVWANSKKNVWNDGFESDASDPDCTTYLKRIDSLPLKVNSSLYYALCVKCRDNIFKQTYKEINTNINNEKMVNNFESTSSRSFLYRRDSETFKGFEKANKNPVEVSAEFSHFVQKEAKNDKKETDVEIVPVGTSKVSVRRNNKNNAEGDTDEKSLNKVSKLALLSKKELFLGKKIIGDVDQTSVEEDKQVFDNTEVALIPESKTRKDKVSYHPMHKSTGGIAEVFTKTKKIGGNIDRNMTDAESKIIFAESEDFYRNEDFLDYKFYFESTTNYKIHSQVFEKGKDVCVIEIENKLSRSKIQGRIKTVEVLGDESVRNMKNMSTEVILICEKVSNNDLCLEACQSNASTLGRFTEMGQCYLKDSKDSSMYLIEIPLHFTHPQRK